MKCIENNCFIKVRKKIKKCNVNFGAFIGKLNIDNAQDHR